MTFITLELFRYYVRLLNRALSVDATVQDRIVLYNWLEWNDRESMNEISEFHIKDNIWLCPIFEGEGPDEDGWYVNYKLVDAVFMIR